MVGKLPDSQEYIYGNISGLRVKLRMHVKDLGLTKLFFSHSFPVPKKDHIVLIRPREAHKRNVFPRALDL